MSESRRLESDQQSIGASQAGTFLLGMVLILAAFTALFVAMFAASIGNSDEPQIRELGSTSLAFGMSMLIVTTIAMRFRRYRWLYLLSTSIWLSMGAIALIIVRDSGYAVATSAVVWTLLIGVLTLVTQVWVYLRSNQPYPPARKSRPQPKYDSNQPSPLLLTVPLDMGSTLRERVDAQSDDNDNGNPDSSNDQNNSGGDGGGSWSDPVATPESSNWGFSGDSGEWGWSGGDTGNVSGGDSGGTSGGDSGSSSST